MINDECHFESAAADEELLFAESADSLPADRRARADVALGMTG